LPVRIYETCAEAVADIFDGAVIMSGGFGPAGTPNNLIRALRDQGAKNLTCIANAAGVRNRLDILCESGQMRRLIASYPIYPSNPVISAFEERWRAQEVELELVPQGTLAERIRAGGAGLGGFYTPVGVGTVAEIGKEKRVIGGKEYLLELPLRADFALLKACKADLRGNLIYRGTARNFSPLMAMAANTVIVEVDEIVPCGELDPEVIVTPGIFVDRLVKVKKIVV
jgi:3-oxoadipate CoA-transferase alpha subunit